MDLLKKYKLYILTLLSGIFIVTLIGVYCYIESNHIVEQYTEKSSGIIGIADEHLRNDHLEWDFEYPLDEEYVEELIHVYMFSKKGFSIKDLTLYSPKGKVIFSNQLKTIGTTTKNEKLAFLDEENTHLFITKKKIGNIFKMSKKQVNIDTYSPITVNKKLKGYIHLQYPSKPREVFYIYFEQILLPILILLLLVLFIFLVLYIKRHISIEKETENSSKMMYQLFHNASDGIVILDKDKKVKMMNTAMEKMVGPDVKDFIYPISCDHVLQCHNSEGKLCGKDCPVGRESEDQLIEFEMVSGEGRRLNVSASKSSLKNDVTEEVYDIMLIRNETSRKAQELQLQTLEEFEKLMNSYLNMTQITNFIANKVTSISGCDEVLLFYGKSYETSKLLNEYKHQPHNLPRNEDIVAQSYLTKKIVKIDQHNYLENQQALSTYSAKTLVSIPLIVNNQIIGALLLVYKKKRGLGSYQEEILRKFSGDIAALLKLYLLMLETNDLKELNEQLYKLELALQTTLEEKDVPESILEKIQTITKSDFIVYRSTNMSSIGMSGIGTIIRDKKYSETGDIIDFSSKWGRTIYIEDFTKKDNIPIEFKDLSLVNNENLVTIYSVPLIYNNQVLGGMLFGYRSKTLLTEEKADVLRSIVMMLSIHIENKKLHRQIETDATIMERQRISREIHDGLAQNIGFVNIQMHRLKKLIAKNELTKAVQEIDAVKEAVEDSYIELRETIDQLRDLNGFSQTLEDWVREYSNDFERTHRIHVDLKVSHNEKIILNEEQKLQVTRVIQEVFNNIRKHSKAQNVQIHCSKSGNGIQIIIQDDGVGFDMNANHKRKYGGNGLYILKDRMQSIQGELLIHSEIQQGTKVEIKIPDAI